MSFADRIKKSGVTGSFRAGILESSGRPYIYYVTAKLADTLEDVFYFVVVPQGKEKLIEKEIRESKHFHFADYGHILYSGYGQPDPEKVKEINETHGIVWTEDKISS